MKTLDLLRKDCRTVPEGYVSVDQLAKELGKSKDWVAVKLRSIPGMLQKRVWCGRQYWYPSEVASPPEKRERTRSRS